MAVSYANFFLVAFFFVCAWLSFEALVGEPKRALRPIPIDSGRKRGQKAHRSVD